MDTDEPAAEAAATELKTESLVLSVARRMPELQFVLSPEQKLLDPSVRLACNGRLVYSRAEDIHAENDHRNTMVIRSVSLSSQRRFDLSLLSSSCSAPIGSWTIRPSTPGKSGVSAEIGMVQVVTPWFTVFCVVLFVRILALCTALAFIGRAHPPLTRTSTRTGQGTATTGSYRTTRFGGIRLVTSSSRSGSPYSPSPTVRR